ncbi:hypothetical protein PHMEG_0005905 [Phytophthora megakarya]|uniref:Uncharacterized protein n=1 Tax=Phytophthora megakarya TaxID=4795 RepID=A0A225WQE7_9STRA|nr:hypothetical protein PHMEG_0005905 [Phytophthora megakarya]
MEKCHWDRNQMDFLGHNVTLLGPSRIREREGCRECDQTSQPALATFIGTYLASVSSLLRWNESRRKALPSDEVTTAASTYSMDDGVKGGPWEWRPSMDSQLRFEIQNGVLMRRVYPSARAGPASTKVVSAIPLKYIDTVFHYRRGELMASHVWRTKPLGKYHYHAYCPDGKGFCGGLVLGVLDACSEYQRNLSGPFARVVVDAIRPLPTTERGNKYILTFVDYFTR